VKIDKDRAKYFFRRGCELEVPIACASMTGDALKIDEEARLAAKPEEELKESCGGRVCKKTADGQNIFRTETGRPQRWYFQDGRLAPRSVWPKGPAKTEATEKRDSGVPLASAAAPRAADLPLSEQASVARREGDHPRARTLFVQACDGGDAKACFEVGHMFRMGSGGASDDTQARVFYEKACTGGDARGCFNLGFLFSAGIGGPQDSARAQALYEQACQAGEPSACSRLNTMQSRPKSRGSRGPEAPPAVR
jgi:TPR repeat protein